MSMNPFVKNSPILHLYQKSRSKSETNRMPIRSRAKSFREFQVKMITNALDQKHIIQKQYQGQQNREINRQKQFSKYYGLQSFRTNAPEDQPVSKKPAQHADNKFSSHRTSEKISTLINIRPQTAICINSQRYMSYESNYHINNMQYRPSEYMVGSQNSLSKSNSMRSSGKRISFFSQAQTNPYEQQENRNKRSRFLEEKKNKVDKIKEDVHEDYMLTKKSCKNIGNYKRYA